MLAAQTQELSSNLTASKQEQKQGNQEVFTAIKNINMVMQKVQAGSAEMLKGREKTRKFDNLTRIITDNMNAMVAGTNKSITQCRK